MTTHNFGVIPSPPDKRDYPVAMVAPLAVLPSSVRLDDKVMKILDQLFCGTCTGKAANCILSAGHKTNLSSLYIYARCKQLEGTPNTEGAYLRSALKVMKDMGSCTNDLLPYSALKSCLMMPFLTKEMDTSASKYKIKVYARTWGLQEIKQGLAAGHMNLTSFWVGNNWLRHFGEGIIKPGTDRVGLHAVVLCGYDDARQAVRGVNSWNQRWGDRGFFWLDYACFPRDFGEGWAVEVAELAPIPEPIPEPTPEPDTFIEALLKLLKLLIDAIKKWVGDD